MNWKILGRCVEGERFQIAEVNVWDHEWKSVASGRVEVFDPTYREFYRLSVYDIFADGRHVRFAAGETSTNVYMFCVRTVDGVP